MTRAQLLDRARRLALRISLRARPEGGPDGVRLYSVILVAGEARTELVVHVRRVVRRRSARRAKASLPPLRDVWQQGIADHPVSRIDELLPWNVAPHLPAAAKTAPIR